MEVKCYLMRLTRRWSMRNICHSLLLSPEQSTPQSRGEFEEAVVNTLNRKAINATPVGILLAFQVKYEFLLGYGDIHFYINTPG